MVEAVRAHRQYAREIESGIEQHYPGRDIGQWLRGEVSSRKLLNWLEGLPADSWFKMAAFDDMRSLIGESTVQAQRRVKEKVEGLLSGKYRARPGGVVESDGDEEGRVRRR